MININYNSNKPIYEQIYDEFIKLILNKALKPNDKLPSVRELATLTKVNPNTIQKAYKALESGNYICTVKGKGNFVKGNDEIVSAYMAKKSEELKIILESLNKLSIEKSQIIKLVSEILDTL
ncbi:GntR family transcriptional regulator [Sedimentibacter sp. zth1]|uniref:GntR family transcriptional regulator n=1 Tax=Sedimentibacter sp. zth1 TaxID=2816908 RepID=UPI001A917633|nr:GntR family transcriptional regulator [Sedimentibacter sp. zth1]QSX05168.1 GntR family transcriptional regulator [Sedimentibacter sp. zth1]